MESLIFSLNVTMPIFFLMMIGYYFNKINIIDEEFANKINKFITVVGIPVQLFKDLSVSDFSEVWDTKYVIYCFTVTFLSILILYIVSKLLKEKEIRGEFIQAGYRSSASLLGYAFVQNIYGKVGGPTSLMIIGAVPLYNIAAVIFLTKEDKNKFNKDVLLKTLKGILTNTIIIGIVVGMLWSILKIPQPVILRKTLVSFSATVTPMGLMALGASLKFKDLLSELKPTILASIFKLIIFVILFIPVGVYLGFRDEKLVAALLMLGGAATVACFSMAKAMGHKGVLSSGVVVITTIMSTFTLTGGLYILKVFKLI